MATQAGLGQKALEAKDYTAAVKHLTDALKQSNSPLWLIQRSTAHQRLSEYDLSLEDAENAVFAAQSRARRELIATAQFRRAIALHGLKRYGDSRLCFTWVRKLNEKEKGLGMWQAKVAKEYDALPEDAPERVVSIKETPSKRLPKPEEPTKKNTAVVAEDITRATTNTVAPPQTPKEKIRHEWFQSGSKVTITIFAKNVPKDKVEVEISTQAVSTSILFSCYLPDNL
jgi:suppressor of G2 allele of SKP1